MPLETSKPDQSNVEGDKHRTLDKDLKDMVSAITSRVSGFHKPGSSHHEDDDERGVRFVTLAGNNAGATMRSELDDKSYPLGTSLGENDALSTYVNSNFQAVNNSIMLGSNYTTNDPGVHLEISDVSDQHEGQKPADHMARRKGKKKEKESFKSEQSDY